MYTQVCWVRRYGARCVGILPQPAGAELLEKEILSLREQGVEALASLLEEDERREAGLAELEALCRKHGIVYFAFPIPDHGVPRLDAAALDFVEGLRKLFMENRAVALHCAAGIGRSGTMAACLLVAAGLAPEQAMAEVSAARGEPAPETDEQRRWVLDFADEWRLRTEGFVFRRYRPDDRDAVWKLHSLALDAVGANAGPGPWNDDLHHIEEVYLKEGGEFLVVEDQGQIVGLGALRKTDAQRAEIKRMRVHPRYWRRGLGQALLRRLEQRAGEFGYRRLRLDTTIEMTAAQQLYRKNGYREAGRGRLGKFEVLYFEKELGLSH